MCLRSKRNRKNEGWGGGQRETEVEANKNQLHTTTQHDTGRKRRGGRRNKKKEHALDSARLDGIESQSQAEHVY